jgi:hypothetical protein
MTEVEQHQPAGSAAPGTSHTDRPAKHYHHGRTPAAWAGATVAFIGILVGGIGMVPTIHWVVFSIGAALFVLGGILTLVLRKLGLGAD